MNNKTHSLVVITDKISRTIVWASACPGNTLPVKMLSKRGWLAKPTDSVNGQFEFYYFKLDILIRDGDTPDSRG